MSDYYKQNVASFGERIKVLESAVINDCNFACETVTAKSGELTMKLNTASDQWVHLHSLYNPVAEARKLISVCSKEAGLYIVFGFGLGYHVEELLKSTLPDAHIAILEPNRESFEAALRCRSFSKIFKNKRVSWFFGDNSDKFFYFFDRIFDPLQVGIPELVIPPAMNQVYSRFFEKAVQVIKDTVSRRIVTLNTVYVLGADPMINGLQNMAQVLENPGCASLFDKFKNKPAIIVSAGPSLDKNIQELARAKGKAVILCAGSAIKAMNKAGIEPDFVFSIDPLKENFEWFFQTAKTGGAALIASVQTHPDIIKNFTGERFLTYYGNKIAFLFAKELAPVGMTYSGGSVANDCLSFAYLLGADPLVFVGQDLSFAEDGQTHASGINPEGSHADMSEENENIKKVKANNGGEVKIARNFYVFLKWFELWISEQKNRQYINATEGGAFINGTEISTLKEVIDKYCIEDIDVKGIIQEARKQYKGPDRDAVMKRFAEFKDKSTELKKYANRALEALKKLEKACAASGNNEKQKASLLKQVKKISSVMEHNEIRELLEWLVPESVTTVLTKIYAAKRDKNNSYQEAIASYMVYLHKIKEGCKILDNVNEEINEKISREAS